MAYAVLRTVKLKTAGNIGGLNAHLIRSKEVPNAEKALEHYNSRPIGSADLLSDVQKRLQEAGIVKVRKDGVLAVEHLMTASPEHFNYHSKVNEQGKVGLYGDVEKWKAFEKASIEWLKGRYGEKNLVNVTVHKDEQTPHIHAIIVPIDQKGKLNCKSFLGGRERLRDMQSSFAQVHQAAGLQRGIEGSQARHTTVKDFYAHANAFEQAPSLDLSIPAPQAHLQPPATNFLRMMLESDEMYLARQEDRLNKQWKEQHNDNLLKAQQKAVELHKAAQASEVLKIKNKSLEGQLKGLAGQVNKLKESIEVMNKQRAQVKSLIQNIAIGKISVPELVKAISEVPSKEDEKQNTIRAWVKAADIEVKDPKPEIKRSKGLRR
jgi:hypothetical protein